MFRSYTVETKIGRMELTPTRNNSIGVRIYPCVVRGVTYRMSGHMQLVDGVWKLAPRSDIRKVLTVYKPNADYPSDSARKVIEETTEAHARTWANENREPLLNTERAHKVRECEAARATVEELRAKLDAAILNTNAVRNALADFEFNTGYGVSWRAYPDA